MHEILLSVVSLTQAIHAHTQLRNIVTAKPVYGSPVYPSFFICSLSKNDDYLKHIIIVLNEVIVDL